jgi:hypothetical protein
MTMTTTAPTMPTTHGNPPRGVHTYDLRIVERDGFKYVHVRFMLDDGATTEAFEFMPAYAHALSDELCTASAHAVQK